MAVLVLHSEALCALARPTQDLQRHHLVRAALRSAHQRNFPVRVPSAVLVELYRVAGHLLAAAGAGSELAIDALVVATAIRFGGGVVLTHDPGDLTRLAAGQPSVAIASI